MSAESAPRLYADSYYYEGEIVRLFRGSERGFVRSAQGREVELEFPFVNMTGPLRRFEDLEVGMVVGFDVGWTSSGLRISTLYAESPSERQAGTEEKVAAEQLADGGGEDGDIE